MKVSGWDSFSNSVDCLDAALNLPLSLGKRKATSARTMPSIRWSLDVGHSSASVFIVEGHLLT
jgi:hypothetical protein